MPATRGHARQDKRAGSGLVQPGFEPAAQHAPGFGERIAPSLPGNHQNATQAPMRGLGQECRDLPRSIPVRESVQVQPRLDRNPAATQRDRLTPIQPIERTDPDPLGPGTGLTSLPARPTGVHAIPDDSFLDQAPSVRKPLHIGHQPLEIVLSRFVRVGASLHVIQSSRGLRPAPSPGDEVGGRTVVPGELVVDCGGAQPQASCYLSRYRPFNYNRGHA